MNIEKFEDIIAWQKGREIIIEIYKITNNIIDLPFKNQIRRASISITNNIAEGFERNTDKEFRAFLYIAKGSCGEVRSMLYNALDLKFISVKEFNDLKNLTKRTSGTISNLIKTLN